MFRSSNYSLQAESKGVSPIISGVIIGSAPFCVVVLSPICGYVVSCIAKLCGLPIACISVIFMFGNLKAMP